MQPNTAYRNVTDHAGWPRTEIRALPSRVAPLPEEKGHRLRLRRRRGGLHDLRCAAPEAHVAESLRVAG